MEQTGWQALQQVLQTISLPEVNKGHGRECFSGFSRLIGEFQSAIT